MGRKLVGPAPSAATDAVPKSWVTIGSVIVATGSEARPSYDVVVWIDPSNLGAANKISTDPVIFPGTSGGVEAIVNAKGDLLAGSADNVLGRLPVGTNGHHLVADSAQTLGMKWEAFATGETGIQVGSGSPLSVTTPETTGGLYIDTAATNGAHIWRANGSGNTDWEVIRGDTGWRNVTSTVTFANVGLAANGATQIAIRRIDSQVYLRGKAMFVNDTTKHDKQWAVPSGFQSGGDNTDNHMILVLTDNPTTAGQVYGQIGLRESDNTQWWFNTVASNLSFRGNWQTVQAWPTGSLPGTSTA